MTRDLLPTIYIPTSWTADQALAVVELLDEISCAIWNLHDDKIIEAIHENQEMMSQAEGDEDEPLCSIDDDIPF